MLKRTLATIVLLALAACGRLAPTKDELEVVAPRHRADEREGNLTVLDLKRKGCEERLKAAEQAGGVVSVAVTLSAPKGASEQALATIRERLVQRLPEQPNNMQHVSTLFQLEVNAASVRVLCASEDVYMVQRPTVYEPF